MSELMSDPYQRWAGASLLPTHELPLARLLSLLNPFLQPGWGTPPPKPEAVLDAWRDGHLEMRSSHSSTQPWTPRQHLQRAAYFCNQGWCVPVALRVSNAGIEMEDGWHRLAAAAALRHRLLTVHVQDEDNQLVRWLGTAERVQGTPFFPMPACLGGRRLSLPSHFRN